MNKMVGLTIEVLKCYERKDSDWLTNPGASHSFFTGITYVNKVRFEDGAFWDANFEEIGIELKKIQSDFDLTELEGKKQKDESE